MNFSFNMFVAFDNIKYSVFPREVEPDGIIISMLPPYKPFPSIFSKPAILKVL